MIPYLTDKILHASFAAQSILAFLSCLEPSNPSKLCR
jgi:hypothetical protein